MSTAPRRHRGTALQNWPGSGFTFMGQTLTFRIIKCSTGNANRSMLCNNKKYFLQGYQMVYLQTQNFNPGMYWRSLEWDVLVQFIAIWYI
jgi:hypothetical protein